MNGWRKPLDEFTLRFLVARLTEDREKHLAMAQQAKQYDQTAGEAWMVRAEECARVIKELRGQINIIESERPPPPKPSTWP